MSVPLCSTPALCALGLPVTSLALLAATATFVVAVHGAAATELTPPEASIEQRVQALVPSLEDYIAVNLKAFDVPGLAIGIVGGDRLIYAKGFGFRRRGGAPVDTQTIFQIGSGQRRFLPQRCDRRRPGQVSLGRPGRRPRPRLPNARPMGHAGVPLLRPAGATLRAVALRQRRVRCARLRSIGPHPLLALRRAGVKFPHDLRLHQHYPHPCRSHRCESGRRSRLECGAPD